MAEPDKTREPAINRENKASAMRWALGIAALFIIGVIAWWVSGIPRGEAPDLTPNQESSEPGNADMNQPPAVAPDADSNTGTLDAPPPASSGAGTQ
jgi:hypothetical protein